MFRSVPVAIPLVVIWLRLVNAIYIIRFLVI